MTPEEFEKVQSIFLQVIQLPEEARPVFLETACDDETTIRDEVERLIAADVGSMDASLLASLAVAGVATDDRTETVGRLPSAIGPYRIIRLLATGGMGAVYEAEQERPRRRVAMKVLLPGQLAPKIAARFELEAEFLARLKHAGIAQIYESGVANTEIGQQPFLAMELVEGRPLDEFILATRPGLAVRLRLFCQVCDAVGYAHRRGVIHRDLKPANIMVTDDSDPQIKVLDFGVARATESDLRATTFQTSMGQLVGTVPYMSPEQCAGNMELLDTRSDIYALGVILYEMLTDRLPYDVRRASIPHALRTIQEVSPTPPYKYDRQLRGDLTAILFRALEKDATDRYATVESLAEDVRCYLDSRPVSATPPSLFYQLSKLARRHKLSFTLSACLLALLAFSAIWATLTSIHLARQRDLATTAQEQESAARLAAESTVSFLEGLFANSSPSEWETGEMTVRDLVADGIERLETELQDQPLPRARLQLTLGKVLMQLGDFERAEDMLLQARDAYTDFPDAEGLAVADTCLTLSDLYTRWQRYDDGYRAGLQAKSIREQHFDEDDLLVIQAIKTLAENRVKAGDEERGLALMREALRRAELTFPAGHEEIVACTNNLALALIVLRDVDDQRLSEAEELLQAVLPEALDCLGDHEQTATIYDRLMRVSYHRQQKDAALNFGRRGLAIVERVFHPTHPTVIHWQEEVGHLMPDDEYVPVLRRLLETRRGLYEPDHPDIARTLNALCVRLGNMGQIEESVQYGREALAIYRHTLGSDAEKTAWAAHNLARSLSSIEKYEECEMLWLEAYDTLRQHHDDSQLQAITQSLMNLYRRMERPEAAEAWKGPAANRDIVPRLRDLLAAKIEQSGHDDLGVAYAHYRLGGELILREEYEEAETHLRESLRIRKLLLGEWNDLVGEAAHALGKALYHQQQLDDAEPFYRLAIDNWKKNHRGQEHEQYSRSRHELEDARSKQPASQVVPTVE